MAAILKNYDVVAIQEVVAGPGGAAAIARLHDALNRTGSKWDYDCWGSSLLMAPIKPSVMLIYGNHPLWK